MFCDVMSILTSTFCFHNISITSFSSLFKETISIILINSDPSPPHQYSLSFSYLHLHRNTFTLNALC